MSAESPEVVNPHYLGHVIDTAGTHEVEVVEDVVARNGMKLLAKGARIGAAERERLLQHKLNRPLEDCVQVVGGVCAASLQPVGEALLERHPLLRALCATARARSAPASLSALTLASPLQSMLTVYARHRDQRLDHAAGVAMLALSLARRLRPGDIDRHRVLATAGLVHDIGELYIDPAYLDKGAHLGSLQWRHIVTHPLVAHRVLLSMAGAGPAVAEAVLLHHERLDGFGYPRGVGGDAFTIDGEILAAAEWLMALVEGDASPLKHARMATQLVPGEFSPALLEAVSTAARDAPDLQVELSTAPPLASAVPRIVRVAGTLRRFADARPWIDERIADAGPDLRAVLQAGLQRMLRIQASFSSTGLDAHNPEPLLHELAGQGDADVYIEVVTLVSELEWRMRELERSQRLRASLLQPHEHAVVHDLITRLKGVPPAAGDTELATIVQRATAGLAEPAAAQAR
jgi:HD-GYP domain-containing protein (c-di-GMP phosphodiesterase class II)